MDPTSSSCSSSMSRMKYYDAFLSFRGKDTRSNFISHLYGALCRNGINTFKDNVKLDLGDSRSELFPAIEGSRVAIVTFSENYAGSKWCLDELQKIMELKQEGKLTFIPIFYHVSPGEVRVNAKDSGEKGCYQEAMDDMEAKYGKDPDKVRRWRKALWQGGDSFGITVGQGDDEADVVRKVVGEVSKILGRHGRMEVAKYPVGIGRHLKAIKPLLHIDPHVNDVYMVGLLGQGGAGKTNLSKEICNDIADRFDSWCFLPDVRETTSKEGLAHLQQTLLRKLLSEDGLTVWSVDEGKQLIKDRLPNKKVLVILDDVDESNQLDALAGELNWFGKGSRIIITTRNNSVLTSGPVRHEYHVGLLHEKEAIDLFHFRAFGHNQGKVNVDRGLLDSFIKYAGRLPLALVLLGEYWRCNSATECKRKLEELKESGDQSINSVLKISFDGLEKKHKEIFLDMACFFKGWKVDDVEKILDSCGFKTLLGINTLVERCLVTIFDGEIQMHDLLRAMGQSIVHDECLEGNRIPRRIWRYKDFRDVLLGYRERQQDVNGIVLTVSKGEKVGPIESNDFSGFKNLRILIVENVDVGPQESLLLPRELRWFQWSRCLAHTIEFESCRKLVSLDLQEGEIQQIKERTRFEELKYVNLSGCRSLLVLPDFSKSLKLEYLKLSGCCSLTTLGEAIGDLENLVLLDLSSCKELTAIPSSIYKLRALKKLDMTECMKLLRFPRRPARGATEIFGFPNLECLEMPDCKLKDVEFLNDLTCFQTLRLLNLSGNEFDHIPTCISKFHNLEGMNLRHCKKLFAISELPNVSKLFVDECRSLKTLPSLHTFICQSPKHYMVDLFNCLGLDQGYIHRSLSLEKVRGFVGYANVYLPGEEFPDWVNFQSTEFVSHQVCVPGNISEEDLLGLALFVSFDGVTPLSEEPTIPYDIVAIKAGYSLLSMNWRRRMNGDVHTLFTYYTCEAVTSIMKEGVVDWHNLTLQFTHIERARRWGMHLLCKREEDDHRVEVQVESYSGYTESWGG